jgi:hypothetical protein
MGQAFWGFAISVGLLWLVMWPIFPSIPLAALIWQILWGYRNRKKKVSKNTSA